MGGKQKQAQRTKGNVKPSSSGRSAALLGNVPLSGLSGLKDSLFPSFQTTTTSEELDPNFDPNFQLVLKKMNKKDSTTRVKALQEFMKLVESSDVEVLKAVLPFWPRLYCILAGDVEHKVREVANEAQRTVVTRAKRNIAPYLRQLAGPWFIAQFDTYAPAATAAVNGFQDAFPPNKLIEAIAFCQDEILKFISDNLLDQTSSKPDNAERTEKQERLIVASLQGYSHYLRIVPDDLLNKPSFLQMSENLLQSDQFWNLAADKFPLVRSSWLSVLSAVLEKVPQLLAKRHQQVVKCILGRLNEVDAIVLPYVWQAALTVVTTLDDWSTHCNVDKQVFPRLYNILCAGGHGCASTIFPNMLPLLSSLLGVKENLSDKEIITDSFFRSLREGFEKKTVQQSKSESEAVAQCYMECIRYVGKCDILNSKLVLEYLMPVVEVTLTEKKLNLLSKGVFEHLSHLLHYWSSDKCASQYETVCKCFWDTLSNMFTNVLLQPTNDAQKAYILNQEVTLCLCLKDPTKLKCKVVQKVRFMTDENGGDLQTSKDRGTEVPRSYGSATHTQYIQKFVNLVTLLYLQKVNEENDLCYVIPLSKVLSEFNDPDLFKHLVSNCNIVELFKTLLKESLAHADQYMNIVVELACAVTEHVESTDKQEIMNFMCQEPAVLGSVFQVAQKEKVQPYILQWLQSPTVNEKLTALMQDVCSAKASASVKTLLMECTAKNTDGAFLVDVHTISSMLSELQKSSGVIDVATFAAEFLSTLNLSLAKENNLLSLNQKEELSTCIFKLIRVLFCLCCEQENVPSNTARDTLSQGWQNGIIILTNLESAHLEELINDFSEVIGDCLMSRKTPTVEGVKKLVETSTTLLNVVAPDSLDVCSSFLNGVLSKYELLQDIIIVLCENVETLIGAPFCNFEVEQSSTVFRDISEYTVLSFFTSVLVKSIMSSEPLDEQQEQEQEKDDSACGSKGLFKGQCDDGNGDEDGGGGGDDDDDDVESQIDLEEKEETHDFGETLPVLHEQNLDKLKNFHVLSERIVQLALAVSACEIFTAQFQSMEFYNKCKPYVEGIKANFADLMKSVWKMNTATFITNLALENAEQHGGMWVQGVYTATKEDQWLTVYKSLSDSRHAEYSAQVFFKKAEEFSIPLESLIESQDIVAIACWIKYSQVVPEETASAAIANTVAEWLDMDRKELLYDCDISGKFYADVERIVKRIYFLSVCVSKCPLLLKQNIWDFAIISAAYYAQNLKHVQKYFSQSKETENILYAKSLENEEKRNVSVFSASVLDLLNSIIEFCGRVKKKEFEDSGCEEQASEWKHVFAGEINQILASIFISASECVQHRPPSLLGHVILQKVCSVIMNVEEDFFVQEHISPKLEKSILTTCCKLIHSSLSSLQITAHIILKKILVHLVESDLLHNQGLEDSISDQTKLAVYPLLSAMQSTQTVVDTMLAEFSFGDSCIVQPHTDTYYYTSAYLLLWDLILQACRQADSELRYQYANLLRSEGHLSNLLNNLFFLMPAEILEVTIPKTKSAALSTMFSEPPDTIIGKECTSQLLQHWSCWVYYSAVSRLPALVRQWWSNTPPKVSSVVQRATIQYVTPVLCLREMQALQNQNTKLKNMEVKVHSKAREVVAVYAVDEAQMELIITLPEEYPLATIHVDSHSSSLVGTNQWRNWVKQLSIFLTHQNGSLWDGLLLWKSNLDKRFEGVEECYICFSVLHGTNFQIPKLCCKTCKKKFHSPCLYKWFSTSNKSTCPICRNMF